MFYIIGLNENYVKESIYESGFGVGNDIESAVKSGLDLNSFDDIVGSIIFKVTLEKVGELTSPSIGSFIRLD